MKEESGNLQFTGERFVPEVQGNIKLEHLHRYLQACKIVAEKVVLDISSGEGYGSAMLANKAKKVIGVDISLEAVDHARKRYKRENLEYMVGSCADIPLPDASVDIVVSFETIEHHDQHEQMMKEVKRVLRSTGTLLISSPDKYHYSIEPNYNNPYHVKELYQHEFKQLLGSYFKNIVYFGQRVIYGSGIFSESSSTEVLSYVQEHESIKEASGMIKPLYWVALASDVQLPALPSGILEQPLNDSEIVSGLQQTVAEHHTRIVNLYRDMAERDGRITGLMQTIGERDVQVSSLLNTLTEREAQIANLNQVADELLAFRRAVQGSILWKLSNTIRTLREFYQNIRGVVFRSVKKNGIRAIKYCYRRLPFSPSQKNFIMDVCYQRFPRLFRGVPSYELWRSRKSVVTSNGTDFVGANNDWNMILPAFRSVSEDKKGPPVIVDVIVPVYRGLEQTRRCIDSLLTSAVTTSYRLIVINDASPENEITEYLRELSSSKRVVVIENQENLGFPATVNRGMGLSDQNDIVLLNSDTEVANDWLDKLKAQAYSGAKVGTVTPFSNNATICNYPTLEGMLRLPAGETTQSLDAAFARANWQRNIELPTAVGFCMYIRRDCLDDVGLFDVETFGKGYGEENDFCLKASAKGWKHLLAADTFVFHEGEVSFQGESNPKKMAAMRILRGRYPDYETIIAKHVSTNAVSPLRVAATAARFKQGHFPVVLHILHSYGGGTEKHVEELCRSHQGKARLLIMSPPFLQIGKSVLQIRSADPSDALDINLPTSNVEFLALLLESFGVSLVHIHHVLGYQFDLRYLIKKLGTPFYLTVHDYMLICPRINLMPIGKDYCGEPEPHKCNQCILVDSPQGASDIIWWRESHSWLFNDASFVICPSYDVLNRCRRYFPYASYKMISHEKILIDPSLIKVPTLNGHEPLRIAILGVLARHKGAGFIADMLSALSKIDAPLQFQLIGFSDGTLPSVPSNLFRQTGQYQDAALPELIEKFDPHLILFPARWPETYSYTLTTAMNSGRPIMVPDIGAFSERVASRPWTWVFDLNSTPRHLLDRLCEIRAKYFLTRTPPTLFQKSVSPVQVTVDDSGFYESGYFAVGKNDNCRRRISDIRSAGKVTALILVENTGYQPSPCAYIRLILPLIRERSEKFDFRWVSVEAVSSYAADVLILQRTAITSIAAIEKIIAHCRENNIRIVYDIDDLLLALPDTHPEYSLYMPKAAAVFRCLVEADEVWVSTERLRQQVSRINGCTHVIPNYLDNQLWVEHQASEPKIRSSNVVRLLYMGTQTHLPDFELVKDVLKRLKNEFPDRIEINLIGISEQSGRWYQTVVPPPAIGSAYPAFVNWIRALPSFDIGIAPLVDHEFNRCKSAIKFFEYSALGLATVASDLGVYTPICNGESGFLVENTQEAWYKALKTLITDSALLRRIQQAARTEVFGKYGYQSVDRYRTTRLTALLSKPTEGGVKASKKIIEENQQNQKLKTVDVNRNLIASAFLAGVGIEIGALHNPLPVPSGIQVRYVDRMEKQRLYEHYPELRPHNLVDVDFIDNGETLSTFGENTQDFIIANHFLEHCEDPIATLNAFSRVLRKEGVVFLALPDMRFTFDKNRQRTTLPHLVRDHLEGSITSRFEHFCEWAALVEPHFDRVYHTKGEIESRARELMNQGYSIHYHAWLPQDVHEMLQYCIREQGMPFEIVYFISKSDEMIIILRKNN